MAYNQGLAQRVREMLDELEPPGLAEKKMFGGVAFMLRGNLACGVLKYESDKALGDWIQQGGQFALSLQAK